MSAAMSRRLSQVCLMSNYSIVKQMVIIIVHIFLNILITLSTFSVNFVFFIRDLAFLLTSIKFQNAYLYNYFYFLLFFSSKASFRPWADVKKIVCVIYISSSDK